MKFRRNTLHSVCAGALFTLSVAVSLAANAQELDNPDAMSAAVGKALAEVVTVMDAGNVDNAAAALRDLRTNFDSLDDYEKLKVLQIAANVDIALRDYPAAIADYTAILQMNGVPQADRLAALDATGQLYLEQADWNNGIKYLLDANTLQENSNVDTLMRLAYAYGQLGKFDDAIPYSEKALEIAGEQASEDDYRNMAVLYIQAKHGDKAIETYESFLERYPDSANREAVSANLAALYIETRDKVSARAMLRTLIRDFPDSDRLAVYRQSLATLN